ncbi:MAG: hypothetical protein IKE90_04545 [Bacilli bacterium]|nr:hypothetical protein [Bacilli bacterium]
MQVKNAVTKDNKAKPIAARIRRAVKSGNNNATIIKAIKTIAETKIGLLINFCKAIENNITAIGITTKYRIIDKASIKHNLSKD